MIRLGLRLTLAERSRSGAARARHRGSRRPRRRSAAGRPGRRQRAARPDRPWRVARHLGAGAPVDVGHFDIRPAVVAVEHRSVRQPGDRSRRRCRHRTERSGPAGDCRTYRDRVSTTPRRPSRRSSRPSRRTSFADRFPGRQIGTIGAAALPSPNSLIIVIGHTARQLSQAPGAVEVGAIQHTPASCYACQNARRERTCSAVDPGWRSRLPVAAGAHLDRDGEPAVGRAGVRSASPPCGSSAPRRVRFRWSPRWRRWSRRSRASQSASPSSSSSGRCSTTCRSPERPSLKATSRCRGSTSRSS